MYVYQIQRTIQPKPTFGDCQTAVRRQRARKSKKQVSAGNTVATNSKDLRSKSTFFFPHIIQHSFLKLKVKKPPKKKQMTNFFQQLNRGCALHAKAQ